MYVLVKKREWVSMQVLYNSNRIIEPHDFTENLAYPYNIGEVRFSKFRWHNTTKSRRTDTGVAGRSS